LRNGYEHITDDRGPHAAETIWREAADALGAEMRRISTFLEFRLGSKTTRIGLQMTTPLTDRVSWLLMADKALTLELLAEAGIPVPKHVMVDAADLRSARAFLAQASPPLVVKPVESSGGSGVTGNVRTVRQLRAALTSAGRLDERVLVEQQVEGDSYRLLFLDGRLLDVIRRPLPQLTGDGTSTIEALLFREFERRIAAGGDAAGYKPPIVDLDCLFTLAAGGHRLGEVLQAGRSIVFKTATNYSGRDKTETVEASLVGGIVEPARRAAEVLGVRLAGVDVITTDPRRPLAETGGVVLEVNTPGLDHHYNVADPTRATRVAVPVLAALLGVDAPASRA